MNDTTIKFRVPTSDFENWKKQAEEARKTLSAWIRGKCNGGDRSILEIGQISEVKEQGKKTCPHGIEKGWRCTLCGGVVK